MSTNESVTEFMRSNSHFSLSYKKIFLPHTLGGSCGGANCGTSDSPIHPILSSVFLLLLVDIQYNAIQYFLLKQDYKIQLAH